MADEADEADEAVAADMGFPVVWRPRRGWVAVGMAGVGGGVPLFFAVVSPLRAVVGGLYLVGSLLWAVGASAVLADDTISKRFFGRPVKQVRFPAKTKVSRRRWRLEVSQGVWGSRSVVSFERWYWHDWDNLVRRIDEANTAAGWAPAER